MPEGETESDLVARATRILLERTARTVGAEFFEAMARGVAEALGTRYGFVGQLIEAPAPTVRTLAVWNGDGYAENFTYSLAGTPCADVMSAGVCHIPSAVTHTYPEDALLVDMGVESYLGLPITDRRGRPVGVLVALHDRATQPSTAIAEVLSLFADRAAAELERLHYEAELARSEARYRQIVSSCIEGVWLIDIEAKTTFVNRQMATMLGHTEAEMIGRPLFDFMDAAGRELAEANLSRRASGVAEHHEFRFLHASGHDVWTMVAASPLLDAGGAYAGAVALVTDVTEKRRLEAAARDAQKLEAIGVLAAGVAHDFNNLLVGILGNAEVALRSPTPERAALEDIRAASLRAAELTRQLLAFAGKGRFVMAPVDLNALVSDLARLLSPVLSKKATLRFGAAPAPAMVEADAGQLNQVVMNLVINASEALGDHTGEIRVTTGQAAMSRAQLDAMTFDFTRGPGDYVLLEVADTGCGIDPAGRSRIFEPFFSTKFAGRGLGLAALLGILRVHRGAIRLDSEVGRGSTFRVLLPACPPSPERSAARSAPPQARAASGRVILLADDEPMVRRVATRLLEAEGYAVIPAVDGSDALARLSAANGNVDLVVLDLTMPGIPGDEVYRELRRRRPELKILVTSGYAEADAASRLDDAAIAFLPKPWTHTSFVEAVHRALAD